MPLAWNVFLHGNKEASWPVLGMTCTCFVVLKSVHPMTPGQPHCYVYSWWEEKGLLHQPRKDTCRPSFTSTFGQECWPWGTHTHYWGCSCSGSSLWVKCFSIQCLVSSVFLSNSDSYKLQWVDTLVLLLLVIGSRCHLSDGLVHWAKLPTKYTWHRVHQCSHPWVDDLPPADWG